MKLLPRLCQKVEKLGEKTTEQYAGMREASPRTAMTYVGTRPTVNSGPRQIETNILDYAGDLYGRKLELDLIERLRPDEEWRRRIAPGWLVPIVIRWLSGYGCSTPRQGEQAFYPNRKRMRPFHDLFVGGLAILIGCLLIAGAAANSPTLMALANARQLSEAFGMTAARWIIAAIGGVSILLGALIASGWRIHW